MWTKHAYSYKSNYQRHAPLQRAARWNYCSRIMKFVGSRHLQSLFGPFEVFRLKCRQHQKLGNFVRQKKVFHFSPRSPRNLEQTYNASCLICASQGMQWLRRGHPKRICLVRTNCSFCLLFLKMTFLWKPREHPISSILCRLFVTILGKVFLNYALALIFPFPSIGFGIT